MFANVEHEVPLRPLSSGVCVYSFRPAYPADPDCVDTSKPGRLRRLPHSTTHSTYPRRTAEPVLKMRPNLFFIDFNRSGDCLFVFLHYISHGLFSFLYDYGLVTIINQKTGLFSSPFSLNVRNFPDVICLIPFPFVSFLSLFCLFTP